MNIHRAAVVLSLLAVSPALAADVKPALTAAQAEAAVATAAARAAEAAETLKTVPAAFAGTLVAMTYAGEPCPKAVNECLDAKAEYWNSVSGALKAENERLSAEIDEMSRNAHNGVEDAMMSQMRLARVRAAARLILEDISADAAYFADPAKESGQAILDRKAEAFRRLAQLNSPRR